MEYFIKGNTYPEKENLKAWGCYWDADEFCWRTPSMEKDEICYKAINNMGFTLVPIELTEECQQIQDILKDF